ncbi:MAG: DegT/DnrJ/EryC1/StrS family aminotransferase [Candidatus Pelagibacter sp.]
MIPVFKPILEKKDVSAAFETIKKGEISGTFSNAINVLEKNFAKFNNTKYAVSVSSGTTALHLAVACLNLPRGSEVIVSSTTNIATGLAITHNNLTPIFIDSKIDTWNIDENIIEKRITKKTKAIIVVHFLGNPCKMNAIVRLAKKYKLYLIEDCAEAHGATYQNKMVGSFGIAGCYSFYANKIISSGEGGLITTNDKKFYEKLILYKNLGFTIPRFKHYIQGYNFRMTGMQAAIANSQLSYVDEIIKKKIIIQKTYEKYLKHPNIKFLKTENTAKSVYWMVGILLSDKIKLSSNKLQTRLKKNKIDTRNFFMSMNEQPCFKKFKSKIKTFNSNKLWNKGLYLPSSHNLTAREIKFICKKVLENII